MIQMNPSIHHLFHCLEARGSIIKMGPDLSRMIIESLVDGQRIFTDLSESQI